MALKIAIVAHACRGGGGLFQTMNLLKAFRNVAQHDEHFLLVCSKGCGFENIQLPPNSQLYVYRGRHNPLERYWFELVVLPKIIKRFDADVVYSPGNTGLTRPPVPQALFIRNAYLFYPGKHYPDMYPWLTLRIAALKSQVRKSLPGTKLIFCQTPVVKNRFSEKYNYPQDNIKVLGFPPPDEIKPPENSQPPAVLAGNPGCFNVLIMTCFMPHKSPAVLIPLCRRFGGRIRQAKIRFITTVRPTDHPRAPAFLKEIAGPDLKDTIINLGQLSRDDVARFMYHCDLFWLPTLLECLSTSHLEALSVGIPILAPDLDFARYVCDDAAVYYDPWSIDSIFEKLMLLRNNPQLRQELVAKGKLQLQKNDKFPRDWNEVAAVTLAQLRKLAGK